MREKWKEIKTHPRYCVSDHGRVKNIITNKFLSPRFTSGGYVSVALYENKKRADFKIHQLVTKYFMGDKPAKLVINHKDGCKVNNNYLNLEYVTHGDNLRHAYRTGLMKLKIGDLNPMRIHPESVLRGEDHPNSKLDWGKVSEIREMKRRGLSHLSIAKFFGVAKPTIKDIISNRTWKLEKQSGYDMPA